MCRHCKSPHRMRFSIIFLSFGFLDEMTMRAVILAFLLFVCTELLLWLLIALTKHRQVCVPRLEMIFSTTKMCAQVPCIGMTAAVETIKTSTDSKTRKSTKQSPSRRGSVGEESFLPLSLVEYSFLNLFFCTFFVGVECKLPANIFGSYSCFVHIGLLRFVFWHYCRMNSGCGVVVIHHESRCFCFTFWSEMLGSASAGPQQIVVFHACRG